MYTCPECGNKFQRRARGGRCPNCNVELHKKGNKYVRMVDKVWANALYDTFFRELLAYNSNVIKPIGELKSRQLSLAYDLVFFSRGLLEENYITDIEPGKFANDVIEYIFNCNEWWVQKGYPRTWTSIHPISTKIFEDAAIILLEKMPETEDDTEGEWLDPLI